MRRIDRWVGIPACALLSSIRFIRDRLVKRPVPTGPAGKILFIKLAEQGATVLAYRAIRRAAEMAGAENVYFLAFEENREILDLLGLIPPENVLTVRSNHLAAFLLDIVSNLYKIRRLHIDACVDFDFFARYSALLAYLTGAVRRVGLHRFASEGPYRGDLLTHRLQHNPYLHAAPTFLMMVEALEADPAETPMLKSVPPAADFGPPLFRPAEGDLRRVRELLNDPAGRPKGNPILLLNPNASDMLPLRKWPSHRFVELGQMIAAHYPEAALVITGTTGEREAAGEIMSAIGSSRAVNLAGRTTLRDLVTLYSLADVLVTNDSGPSHFASLTEIHNIALFGPETPAFFGPVGDNAHVIWAGLACSPCVSVLNHRKSPCRNNVCMQAISVDQVFGMVREILSGP